MIDCKKCGNWFRDKYALTRHMSRIKPCVNENNKNPNDTKDPIKQDSAFIKQDSAFIKQDSAFVKQNSAFDKQNSAFDKECNKCIYCLQTFFNNQSKKRHENKCKHNNEIRLLEIELGITPVIPESRTRCRFCEKIFFRTDSLSKHKCKEQIDYHQQILLKEKEKLKNEQIKIETQNNINQQINNCNNIQNNINIYFNENTIPFGNKRLTDHIKVERLVEILRESYRQYTPDQDYEIAGELLIKIEEYLQEIPENRNYLTDQKSAIWTIKTETGVKYLEKDKCLNSIVKENAGFLCEKKGEINESNTKVFENKTIQDAFYHENEFNKKGIHYKPQGEKKINKIKAGLQVIQQNKPVSIPDF